MRNILSFWRDLSISKKLYAVFGIMALFICIELASLSFALGVMSSVRALVEGEGLWSKSQKNAVNALQQYIVTGDQKSYDAYQDFLKVPFGDRQARLELEKPNPNPDVILDGFRKGQIHPDDIEGVHKLLSRFHDFHYLKLAIGYWRLGDQGLDSLIRLGETVHDKIQKRHFHRGDLIDSLAKLDTINKQLTVLETQFSSSLGSGSRWLEHRLMLIVLILVLTVEASGLTFTYTFSRYLSRGLAELSDSAKRIGRGDLDSRTDVKTKDELGQLAASINKMAEELKTNVIRRKEAEHFSEIKTQFLANMSHEIRTPLGAVMGFAELLDDNHLTPIERHDYLNTVKRAGQNLMTIINDILDISKVETGHLTIAETDFSLIALLDDLQRLLNLKCEEKGIQLQFNKANDLPDSMNGDPGRVRQILLNVLSNAIKYTEHGSVTLSVQIRGDSLYFDVKDTGIGIRENERSAVFEVFRQGGDANLARKYSGTGLGLPLSKHLAQMLGGDLILVDSQIGKGSHFQFNLKYKPAREQTLANSNQPMLRQNATQKKIDLSNLKVLVADDNVDNRHLIEMILKKWGCHADFAENGQQAIDKVNSHHYDVVVMDVQMPVMDGIQAVQTLRRNGVKIPIIALTARAMKSELDRCLEVGYTNFLTKPIEISHFINMLNKYQELV